MQFLNFNKVGGLIFLSLLSGTLLPASQWMWHGEFPWVYSNDNKSWQYWQVGGNEKLYQWDHSTRKWKFYENASKTWRSIEASELNATQWAIWEKNPDPFGGLTTLQKSTSST